MRCIRWSETQRSATLVSLWMPVSDSGSRSPLLVAVAPVTIGGVVPGRRGITVRVGAIRVRRILGRGWDAERYAQGDEAAESVTVVVIAENALMPAGEVTEVPRRELPTTDLAATSI